MEANVIELWWVLGGLGAFFLLCVVFVACVVWKDDGSHERVRQMGREFDELRRQRKARAALRERINRRRKR